MRISYVTSGSCAKRIDIDREDGIITETAFIDGCPGNTRAVAALVRGMAVSEVISRLKGIACKGDTSCPDELARVLEEAAA